VYDLKSDLFSCGIITGFRPYSEILTTPFCLDKACRLLLLSFLSILNNQKNLNDFFFFPSMKFIIGKLELEKAFFTDMFWDFCLLRSILSICKSPKEAS